MAGELVIQVDDLRMSYGDREVVRGVDLSVARGEIFALLGPNGAGKTTTVEILEGYRQRSGGQVAVLGADPEHVGRRWRGRVGVVLQTCALEPDLTVAETIQLYAGFYDQALALEEVLGLVGLTAEAGVRAARLSGGQQRRLDVALALVGDPELVFLDEPTTGFDPAARRLAWEVISDLRRRDKTIFLTTHYLEEAEVLADRIAVMAAGQIVACGPPATLADRHRQPAEIVVELVDEVPELPGGLAQFTREGRRLSARTESPVPLLNELTGWLVGAGLDLAAISVHQPSLEDVYLALTGGAEPQPRSDTPVGLQ